MRTNLIFQNAMLLRHLPIFTQMNDVLVRSRLVKFYLLCSLFMVLGAIQTLAQIDATFSFEPPTCPDGNNGQLCCETITGGVAPYTCSLVEPVGIYDPATDCFYNMPSGTWHVQITDSLGTTGTAIGYVGPSSIPPYVVTENITPASCGGSNGAICLTVSGGSGSYTYIWFRENPDVMLGTGTMTANQTVCITNQPAGDYTFIIDDNGNNCGKIYSLILPATDLQVSAAVVNSDCVAPSCNGSIDLTLIGTAPFSVIWTGTGGFSSTGQDLANLCSGTYTVNVTDANGCTGTGTYTVGLNGADVTAGGLGSANNSIATNTLWNPTYFGGQSTIIVDADVIVASGVHLNIENLTVLVTPGHSIRALSNAHIDVLNGHFDVVCGAVWRGFDILGSTLNPPANRAELNMVNSSIRHAQVGIRNHKGNFTNNSGVGTIPGGKLTCTGVLFEDNVYDLRIYNYSAPTPNATNYSGDFLNCIFRLNNLPSPSGFLNLNTDLTNQEILNYPARIHMLNTADVRFFSCTLENNNVTIANSIRTFGLRSDASNFRWTGPDAGNAWTQANYTSRVSGWRCAFSINNHGPLADAVMLSALVTNTYFQNHQGIFTSADPSIAIANNYFGNYAIAAMTHGTITQLENTTAKRWVGIYMNNATFATNPQFLYIAHNLIDDIQNLSDQQVGMYLQNTGSLNNFIIENTIRNCKTGIYFNSVNRNNSSTATAEGVHYECNDFETNFEDVVFNGSSTTGHGVASPQRNFYITPIGNLSAGNNFTLSTSTSPKDDISTATALNLSPHSYYVDINTDITNTVIEMTSGFHTPSAKVHNNCLYNWRLTLLPFEALPAPSLSPLVSLRQNLADKKNELNTIVDGGLSDEVLLDINSLQYQQAYSLYLDLLSISPALSEEVMIAAIQKEYELPKALLTHILASNPQAAKNAEVQEALDQRTDLLSEYQRNQINTGRSWMSNVELLEADIVGVHTQIEKEIFRFFVSNSAVGDYLNALDDDNYNENLLKAAVLAESGMLDEARLLLEKAASKKESFIDANSISTWLQIMAINYDLRHGQLPISESHEMQLLAIWENNTNGMGSHAHALLQTFAGYAPEENANGELRNEVASDTETENLSLDVALWPVPAGEFINVKFDNQINAAAKIVVYNYSGQSVLEYNMSSGQVETVLDISQFNTGFYTLTLVNPVSNEILGSKFFYKK
jgi:hypothetical protein